MALTEQQQGVKTICEVCGWDAHMMGGRAARLYSVVVKAGGTWMDVEAHYSQVDHGAAWWWYRDHWLGRKGERPDDGWIRKTWKLWEKPLAVQLPARAEPAGYDSLRAFLERTNDVS